MNIPNEAMVPEIRETPVKTEPSPLSRSNFNPTRVFVDKVRTAFLWFCVAVLAIIFAAAPPVLDFARDARYSNIHATCCQTDRHACLPDGHRLGSTCWGTDLCTGSADRFDRFPAGGCRR